MNVGLTLLIVLVLLMVVGFPGWGYHQLGYWPSGGVGIVVLVLIVLFLMGRL